MVKTWLRVHRHMTTLSSAIRGLNSSKNNLEARMGRVSLGLLVYLIWEERNTWIFESTCKWIDLIFSQIPSYVLHNPTLS